MATVLLKHTVNGKEAINVYDFDLPNGAAADLVRICDEWETYWLIYCGGTYVFRGAEAPGPNPVVEVRAAVGTNPADCTSINTAVLVKKVPDAGRVGRMYLPGTTENNVDGGGVLDGVARDQYQASLTSFLGVLALEGIQMNIARTSGATSPVTDVVVEPTMGTQRRRMRR